jgi:putative hydrolase of the HAD superfamily
VIKTILFDWGDTLMRVFPQYAGPMSDWPQVQAVAGAADMLSALRKDYTLAIATNAADSGEALIRKALSRAGLEEYFSFVLSAKELGAKKPSPEYYQKVIARINSDPSSLLMVGDDYRVDILGAKDAGIHACWFNEDGSQKPPLIPFHDAEIRSLGELAGILSVPLLPDLQMCLEMMAKEGTGKNLLKHVFTVGQCAYLLACMLSDRGIAVDPLLAQRGGILHDLDKISGHTAHRPHGDLTAEILLKAGYPRLSQIAFRHIIFTILEPDRMPRTMEEKTVYYADKIAEGSRIVDVSRRIEGLVQRHPQHAQSTRLALPAVLALEREFCEWTGLPPEELIRKLSDGVEKAIPFWEEFLRKNHFTVDR